MSCEELRKEKLYQVTMTMIRRMLEEGLISKEEYAIIDTKMKEKYGVIFGTLFTDIDLM